MSDHRLVRGTLTVSGAPYGTVETCIERASRDAIADSFADLLRVYLTRGQFTRITVRIEEAS
jgi:hypothetical protein